MAADASRVQLVTLAAAGPIVAAIIAGAVMLLMAAVGTHPFWPYRQQTLSEAAAAGDRGEVTRLIAAGDDPNGTYSVRRGVLRDEELWLTPLVAAVASNQDEMIAFLLARGAVLDAETWLRLFCFARDQQLTKVLVALAARAAPDPLPECNRVTLW